MQFKLPKQLDILGLSFDIVVEKEDFLINGGAAIGGANHEAKIIRIKDYGNPQTTLQILFHEVIHMIQDILESDKKNQLDESQINLVANGITTVIMNNPALFDVVPLDEDLED